MTTTIDMEAFKKAWFSFEEIQKIIQTEKNFNKTGVSYPIDDAFSMIKKEVFSKGKQVCTK